MTKRSSLRSSIMMYCTVVWALSYHQQRICRDLCLWCSESGRWVLEPTAAAVSAALHPPWRSQLGRNSAATGNCFLRLSTADGMLRLTAPALRFASRLTVAMAAHRPRDISGAAVTKPLTTATMRQTNLGPLYFNLYNDVTEVKWHWQSTTASGYLSESRRTWESYCILMVRVTWSPIFSQDALVGLCRTTASIGFSDQAHR
jgi:hypothetical protein